MTLPLNCERLISWAYQVKVLPLHSFRFLLFNILIDIIRTVPQHLVFTSSCIGKVGHVIVTYLLLLAEILASHTLHSLYTEESVVLVAFHTTSFLAVLVVPAFHYIIQRLVRIRHFGQVLVNSIWRNSQQVIDLSRNEKAHLLLSAVLVNVIENCANRAFRTFERTCVEYFSVEAVHTAYPVKKRWCGWTLLSLVDLVVGLVLYQVLNPKSVCEGVCLIFDLVAFKKHVVVACVLRTWYTCFWRCVEKQPALTTDALFTVEIWNWLHALSSWYFALLCVITCNIVHNQVLRLWICFDPFWLLTHVRTLIKVGFLGTTHTLQRAYVEQKLIIRTLNTPSLGRIVVRRLNITLLHLLVLKLISIWVEIVFNLFRRFRCYVRSQAVCNINYFLAPTCL